MKHLLLLACAMPLVAMENLEINKAVVFAPNRLGALSVIKKASSPSYSIVKDDVEYPVKNYNIDKLLTKMDNQQLESFLANGRIDVSQMSDDEYVLRAKGKIKGGGPITAFVVSTAIRVVGYSAPVAATAVVAPNVVPATVAGAMATTAGATGATVGATIVQGIAAYVGGVEALANTAMAAITLMPWCP